MLIKRKLAALSAFSTAALVITAGCHTQPNHPNQLNAFDGASYNSLTLAHGALSSLRADITTGYPRYTAKFNEAAAAYSTAYNVYSVYRSASGNQADLSTAIANLTLSIVALENAFTADLHVSASNQAKVHAALATKVTVVDILAELEIAAVLAKTVSASAPYAALATVVIAATESALTAENLASGQPIDLSTIPPINPIQ
jgi:hypothetical protein